MLNMLFSISEAKDRLMDYMTHHQPIKQVMDMLEASYQLGNVFGVQLTITATDITIKAIRLTMDGLSLDKPILAMHHKV